MSKLIKIRGARAHNLKNINLDIPRDQLVVITGLSGSGKSSLAFDTIYAEGQRRYVESLSSYARMFLGQMQKPDVDLIEGLSPAISIDQKTTSHNPRSTVGTSTEIYDYLRLLYARVGKIYCPNCGKEIQALSIDQIIDQIKNIAMGKKLMVFSPIVRGRKGTFSKLLESYAGYGYQRVRVDGDILRLDEDIKIEKNKKHDIDLLVDRISLNESKISRLSDSVERALEISDGLVLISIFDEADRLVEQLFSQNNACPDCNISVGEISPQSFSFNNPLGACPECSGLGKFELVDPEKIIHDDSLSLVEGAIDITGFNFSDESSWSRAFLDSLAKYYSFDVNTPFGDLSTEVQNMILYGNGEKIPIDTSRCVYKKPKNYKSSYEGVIPILQRRFEESQNRDLYGEYFSEKICPSCAGARLRKESLSVKIADKNIDEVCHMSLSELSVFFQNLNLNLSDIEQKIAEKILEEIGGRVKFLIDVGLDYINLARSSSTLSGGESQRIRLASQIGSALVGVLYILDEPSIGLHQRDNQKLINTLKHLRDLGNSVLVVEHDEETMAESDYIVDMGPRAGEFGGEVVACGTYDQICLSENSLTGKYLSGRERIYVPTERRKANQGFIEIKGACENNLKNVDVKFPKSVFTCITGVSGSGKSSLVNSTLLSNVHKYLQNNKIKFTNCKSISGLDDIDKIIAVDQSPIGRTPRSNPATYTGVFSHIRELFAGTNMAKAKGYKLGRFSFNVKGGRCEACSGDGVKKIEMQFLPDVYVECDVCHGKRYNHETLEVKWKDKSIADVLDMTVSQAVKFFANIPKIASKLQTLEDVGLGYIKLGQSSTQLSGGEAQRVKLAAELSKKNSGNTLYILDEPTTGLHMADVKRLIKILNRLTDKGNTVIVIEHNLDVIKCADYIIDLGPEGGEKGGKILAYGSPEELAKNNQSYTGRYINGILEREKLLNKSNTL